MLTKMGKKGCKNDGKKIVKIQKRLYTEEYFTFNQ